MIPKAKREKAKKIAITIALSVPLIQWIVASIKQFWKG